MTTCFQRTCIETRTPLEGEHQADRGDEQRHRNPDESIGYGRMGRRLWIRFLQQRCNVTFGPIS
jgi:hypothetical protein